jgi:hypothetical protein
VLSRAQNAYSFEFNENTILPEPAVILENIKGSTEYLDQLIRDYMHENNYPEYPIGITDYALPDQLLSSSDEESAVISIHGWAQISPYTPIKGVAYLIAPILLDLHVPTDSHYDTRGCPNDVCEDVRDINVGLAQCEYCDDCRDTMLSALDTGRITLAEMIAVKRILDYVADRRICFVLMPFRDEFRGPYESIKSAVTEAGLKCVRADEIFEPRSIIQIIYEMIERAEVIVADLTNRNPNVFYELGYAHACGKNTILVTQRAEDVPFDIKHRQYVLYDPGDLGSTLTGKVKKYFLGAKKPAGSAR